MEVMRFPVASTIREELSKSPDFQFVSEVAKDYMKTITMLAAERFAGQSFNRRNFEWTVLRIIKDLKKQKNSLTGEEIKLIRPFSEEVGFSLGRITMRALKTIPSVTLVEDNRK